MKNRRIWLAVVLVIVLAGVISTYSYQQKKPLIYAENLEKTVVTVDGEPLTLQDFSYYIVKQELNVEEQAAVYDRDNTNTYWGMRLGKGKFIRTAAKESVLDAVIHNEIFYRMALAEEITLDEAEEEELSLMQYDFWSDLTDEQKDRLGVKQEEVDAVMYRAALAQKYQMIYTLEHTTDSEFYNVGEEGYEQLLREHTYKVNKKVWDRIRFGDIILEHELEMVGTTESD